jgi:hypothetical protein
MKTRTTFASAFAPLCLALLIPVGCDVPDGPGQEIGVPAVSGPRQCPKDRPGANDSAPRPGDPVAHPAGEPLDSGDPVRDDCQTGARANPRGTDIRIGSLAGSADLTPAVAVSELPREWPELRAWFAGRSAQPGQ